MSEFKLPCFLDFEATGLSYHSHPTEVGWSLPSGEIKSMLINPATVIQWNDWDVKAEKLTGITKELLTKEGHHPRWVAEVLNKELKGLNVYSDAVDYDGWWCRQLFEAADISMAFEIKDIWLVFRKMVQTEEAMMSLLFDAEKRLGASHRAAVDVERSSLAYKSLFGV